MAADHGQPGPLVRRGPRPLVRRGPRPLLLHLMLALMRSTGSADGLQSWSAVFSALKETGKEGAAADPAALLEQERAMIAGIAAYRRHPDCRSVADPPVIWQEGEARLLDYAPGGDGRPVMFVPSLVNRGYILDLTERRSMMRFLAEQGVRPLLLDWGWPGEVERRYTLTEYVVGPLERALHAVGQPVTLAGYCMGGLLAVAAAQRRPECVRALAVLATPWDFRAQDAAQAGALAGLLPLLQPIMEATGTVPIDALQTIFALIDPGAVAEKFRRFGRLDQDGTRARLFVAIEDWANDGVPLAAPVARECFGAWYGANAPMLGTWRVAGRPVTPSELAMPCFAAIPGRDRIVPPASARALAMQLAGAVVIEPAVGHVAMVAGAEAETALWQPLLEWLRGT